MKKAISIFAVIILIVSCFTGCFGTESNEMPLDASDLEVLLRWDDYPLLDSVPRYRDNGIFDGMYEGRNSDIVISYRAVTSDAYERYVDELMACGFVLKENSEIWLSEGVSAVPQFTNGEISAAIVWSVTGSMDISVSMR